MATWPGRYPLWESPAISLPCGLYLRFKYVKVLPEKTVWEEGFDRILDLSNQEYVQSFTAACQPFCAQCPQLATSQ